MSYLQPARLALSGFDAQHTPSAAPSPRSAEVPTAMVTSRADMNEVGFRSVTLNFPSLMSIFLPP